MDLYDDPNKGNTEAYARLYDENVTALFRLAGAIVWNREEAEKIVQEGLCTCRRGLLPRWYPAPPMLWGYRSSAARHTASPNGIASGRLSGSFNCG